MFPGDYDQVVGTNKAKFLEECTTELSGKVTGNVECTDVRKGSIVVDVSGPKDAVTQAVQDVQTNGLDLPSFTALPKAQTTTAAPTTTAANLGPCAPWCANFGAPLEKTCGFDACNGCSICSKWAVAVPSRNGMP